MIRLKQGVMGMVKDILKWGAVSAIATACLGVMLWAVSPFHSCVRATNNSNGVQAYVICSREGRRIPW